MGSGRLPAEIPVEAFEHYMWVDDTRDYPMVFYIRAEFSGILEPAKFQKSVFESLKRHRQFQSILRGQRGWRTSKLRWVQQYDILPWIDWGQVGTPFRYPDEVWHGIDLQREIGLRFFIREDGERTTITMQIHHTAADAMGAWQFLEDVLVHYHGDLSLLRPYKESNLRGRGAWHQSAADMRRRLWKDIDRSVLFFRLHPKPLALGESKLPVSDPSTLPSAVRHVFSRDEMEGIKRQAKKEGVTINDKLLCDLFQTVDQWNQANQKRRHIRLAMPTNMRFPIDATTPATNIVSMVFIDRWGRHLDDRTSLLAGIRKETQYIKDNLIGITLCRVSELMGRVPGALKQMVKPRIGWRCAATAVLSNLGDPTKDCLLPRRDDKIVAGNVALEALELMSPYRPYTHGAFGVISYQGQMIITLHYNRTYISKSDAQVLLDGFAQRIVS
jgi:hypothetical protein